MVTEVPVTHLTLVLQKLRFPNVFVSYSEKKHL